MSEGRTLAWLETPDQARHYLDAEALIGRSPRADVRLAGRGISRNHALLRRGKARWILLDLASTNGSFVNAQRLAAPQALRDGDRLAFGETEAIFREAADVPPPPAPATALPATRTPHATLHAYEGSFAAGERERIVARLERCGAALADLLGLDPPPAPPDLYLADVAPPAPPGAVALPGGFADAARRLIVVAYRDDAPGVDLERLLLALARHDALDRGLAVTDPVADALLILATQEDDGEARRGDLAEARSRGELPKVAALFAPGADDAPALADFLAFLRRSCGAAALRDFLAQLGADGPDRAARRACGRSLRALERRWRASLGPAAPGGPRLFFAVAAPYLRPYRARLLELVVYLLYGIGFVIFLAKAQGLLIDRALLPGDARAFALIMATLALAFVIANLAALREGYLRGWLSESVQRDLRLRMFGRVQELHPGYFQRVGSGDIISRMTDDLFLVEAVLTNGVAELVRLSLLLIAALVAVLLTDWRLALLTVVGVPFFFLIGRRLGPPIARASLRRQEQLAAVTTAIGENLGARPVITLFGLGHDQTARFGAILATFRALSLRLHLLGGFYNVATSAVAGVTQLAVLGVGGWLALRGNLSVGALLTFTLLVGQIIGPLESLANLVRFIEQGTGALTRVRGLIEAPVKIADAPDAQPLGPLRGAITCHDLSFDYDGSRPILRGLSLTIPAGSNVAIVGPSGCGKSTLLSLLMRFYDPTAGQIGFDGRDLRAATLASLRGQIGAVFQESVLLNLSIRENIRLGNLAATDAEVEAAARAAELHDLIAALPDGYDTVVGERGGQLSGGQRQRVALARAIIRDPAVLLLDEATSALDPATEAAINATLRRLAAGRTTITVTHRLASVTEADQIYVLDDGRLAEQGTHRELLATGNPQAGGGLYARLWDEQGGGDAEADDRPLAVDPLDLRRLAPFAPLPPATLADLARRMVAERHPAGATIVAAGAIGDRFALIASGAVAILPPGANDAARPLARLGPGDYFGEIALIRDIPRTATVRALAPTLVYSLGKADFLALLAETPPLWEAVAQTLAAREADLRAAIGTGETEAARGT